MKRPVSSLLALVLLCVMGIGHAGTCWAFSPSARDLLGTLREKLASNPLPATTGMTSTLAADLTPDALPLDAVVRQARSGNPEAQVELGVRVQDGRNVVKNSNEARVWFSRAARQGNAKGQYHMARLLTAKKRAKQSIEGYAWAYLAVLNESVDDHTRAEAVELRDTLARTMSPSAILKGRKVAATLAAAIKPEEPTDTLLIAPVSAPGTYVIGSRLQLALAALRAGRTADDAGVAVATKIQPVPPTEAAPTQAADSYAVVDAASREEQNTALMHVRDMPVVPEEAVVQPSSDHENTLQKYRALMAARTQRPAAPAPAKDVVVDATSGANELTEERPLGGMEGALQKLHELKRQREEREHRLGITHHETLLPQELRDRAEQRQPTVTDEQLNTQLRDFEIRQPHDYRIEIY